VESSGRERVEELSGTGLRVGWLTFPSTEEMPLPGVVVVALPAEPAACAAQLYATLHSLDEAGLDRLVVTLPPDTEAWAAVRDRLRRASARG
jgi:L-threonylcarbamoyladenylate synthase